MRYLYNNRARVLVLIVGLFLAVSYAQAATRTFTGQGYWSNAALWGGTIPASGDVISIDGICIFDATTNLAYSTLTVGRNNAGTLTWPIEGTGVLNVTNISSQVDGSSINMTYGGTINLTGSWSSDHLAFTGGTGTVIYSGAAQTGAAYTYNNLTLSNSGIKTFANSPTVTGVLSMEGIATVTVTNGAIIYGTAATLKYNTATSRTVTSEEWITPFTGTGGVIISNTGTITMNSAKVFGLNSTLRININASLSTDNFQLDFGGNFVNNGTFTAGSSPIVITNTGAQLIYEFTTTGLVSMTKTAGTATLRGNVSGGGLTINGPGGTLNLGSGKTHNFSGIWTRIAGTVLGGTSIINFTAAGTVVSGSGGTFTPNTGTVAYTLSGPQTVGALIYSNLTLGGSGLKTTSSDITVNDTLSMKGTATASALPTYGSSAILQYNGNSAQTTGPEFPAIDITGQLSTVKIENPAGVTLNQNKNIGPRSFIIGSFANNSIFKDGGLTLTSTGTLNLNSGSYIVTSGSFPAFTAGTTIAEGTTVEYASASPQTISGITYSNLTISGSGNNSKIAGGNVTVNGILNLNSDNYSTTQGCLDMSTVQYTLTMGTSATTTGTGDVTGIVTRNSFAVNTPYTFGNQFTTLRFQAGGTNLPSSVSVKLVLTAPLFTNAINRYYDIAQTDGTINTLATLNLHYLPGELNGNSIGNMNLYDYDVTPETSEARGASNSSSADHWVGLTNLSITNIGSSTTFLTKYWTLGPSPATNTCTWTGFTNSEWNNSGNWTGGIPSASSDVIIPDVNNDPLLPNDVTSIKSISIQVGGILNATSGTPTLTISGGAGAWDNLGTFDAGTSTVIFTSAEATMADPTSFYNVTVADGATLTPGTNNIMRIAGALSLSETGKLNAASSENTVDYNGSDQIVINPNGSTPGYHNLIFSGSGTKTMPEAAMNIYGDFTTDGSVLVTAGGDLTIAGNVVLGFGTTFDPGTFSHTVSGDWTNNEATFDGGSSNIIFNNTLATQSITGTAFDQIFHDITINKLGQTLIIDGSTTSLTLNNLTLTSGTLDAGTGNVILVEGLWENSGNFEPREGAVDFNGSSEQSIKSINGPTIFNYLLITSSGGVILTGGDIIVNGELDLESANISETQGALHTGEFTLKMGPLSTTTGTADVTGYVERTDFNIGTTYTFGNQLNTVSFLNGSETLPTSLKFKISIGTEPEWQPTLISHAINREYEIVNDGGINCNANITLHYLDSELNDNSESLLSQFRWQSGTPPTITDLGRSAYNTVDNWIENSNVPIGLLPVTFGTVKISIANSSNPTLIWNGSVDSDWNNTSNWTPNLRPTETSSIIIPRSSPYPVIPVGGVTIKTLEIQNKSYLWSNSQPVTITGSAGALIIIGSGNFVTGTGTVTFTGTGATIAGTAYFYNLIISSGADLTNLSGSMVSIAGTMTNNGVWHTVTGTEPSTVEYNGSDQTVVIPNPSTNRYSELILSGTGVKTMPAQQLDITGGFTIDGTASVTANQDLAVSGTITIGSGATFNASTFNLNAGGGWSNVGTFTAGTGKVTFNGTSVQILIGTTTFNNLTINNSAGVSSLEDIAVDGVLDLQSDNPSPTAGTLAIGTLTMNINSTTTGIGDVTGIITRAHTFATDTFYSFGAENSGVKFAAVSGTQTFPSSISVSVTLGDAPVWTTTPAAARLYKLWHTGGSGNHALFRFHYKDNELRPNINENLLSIWALIQNSPVDEGRSDFNTDLNFVTIQDVDFQNIPPDQGDFQVTIAPTVSDQLIWNGSVSEEWSDALNWSSNSGGAPVSGSDVIILTGINQPLINTEVTCANLTIKTGVLTVSGSGTLTVSGTITNSVGNAGFIIQSDASADGALINNNSQVNATVELYNRVAPAAFHFFVPPVSQMTIYNPSNFTRQSALAGTKSALGLINWFGDLMSYSESAAGTNQNLGWQYYDGWTGGNPGLYTISPFSFLTSAKGYDIHLRTDEKISFKGTLNATPHSFNLNRSPGCVGWNLVGNPYPCYINLAAITALTTPANGVDKTIYFSHNNSYAVWNVETKTGTTDYSDFVPSMQGFFVHVAIPGNTLEFTAESKTISSAPPRSKGASLAEDNPIEKVKLVLSKSTQSDETIVCLIDKATTGFDSDYDGYKLFGSSITVPYIYTVLNSMKYAINSVQGPGSESVIIPVTVELKSPGTYKIDISEFENLDGISVVLKHGVVETSLSKNTSYSFTSAEGTFTDFELIFGNLATGLENPLPSTENLKTWYSNNYLYINCPDDIATGIANLFVYDLQGKPVYNNTQVYLISGQTIQLPVTLPRGVYFTRLTVNNQPIVTKIVVL